MGKPFDVVDVGGGTGFVAGDQKSAEIAVWEGKIDMRKTAIRQKSAKDCSLYHRTDSMDATTD